VVLNAEFRNYVESMCPAGLLELLSTTQDEVWDYFFFLKNSLGTSMGLNKLEGS